jgi:hypothetical protein
MGIVIREHPTEDFKPIDDKKLDEIKTDIIELFRGGRTVMVVDSGGETRTGMVCRHMGAVEDTRKIGRGDLVHSVKIPARSVESHFGKSHGSGRTSPPGGSPGLGKRR